MIGPLTLGTERVGSRRVWSSEERFCATSYQVATGRTDWERLASGGARIVVDRTEAGTVLGWGFVRVVGGGPRAPFVFVCRPWLGTQVGEEIRDRLLRELGA